MLSKKECARISSAAVQLQAAFSVCRGKATRRLLQASQDKDRCCIDQSTQTDIHKRHFNRYKLKMNEND